MTGGEYELTWKRSPETGHWLARDSRDGATYVAARNTGAAPGHQWTISVFVPDGAQQTRTGLDRLSTAQVAALATRCHLCFRVLPFATVEASGGNGGWRCRNQDDCAATVAAREAEARGTHLEIRNTDLEEIGVTDTADGPELVFVRAGTGNKITVEVTNTDLDRLLRVLARRNRNMTLAWIQEMIARADELLAAHEAKGEPGAG